MRNTKWNNTTPTRTSKTNTKGVLIISQSTAIAASSTLSWTDPLWAIDHKILPGSKWVKRNNQPWQKLFKCFVILYTLDSCIYVFFFFSRHTGVEINFFNNFPVGQVISNVFLPEKISTCPIKKIGSITFEAVYLWKKNCKILLGKNTEFALYVYPISRIKFSYASIMVGWRNK